MEHKPQTKLASASGPALLAGLGTALLSVAAITLVSDRWDQFAAPARLIILLTASAVVFAATTLLRSLAPTTSRALDVLVAVLAPIDVAAIAIVGGAHWPAVLLATGPAAMISSEVLRRRDPHVVSELGTTVGGVLTLCGVAASLGIAVAPLVAALGLAAIVVSPIGRDRLVGPAWAALAGLAPALRVLEDATFTGDGTLRDVGLLDATSTHATIAAGVIATVALAIAAVRRRSVLAGLTAIAAVATASIDLWARFDPPNSALLIAAAIGVLAIEVGLSHRAVPRDSEAIALLGQVISAINGVLTVLAVSVAAGPLLSPAATATADWKFTAAICAVGWLVADLRRSTDNLGSPILLAMVGGNWGPAVPGFAWATLAAVQLGTNEPAITAIVAMVLASLALMTLRPGRLITAWSLAMLAPLLAVAAWQVAVPLALAAAIISAQVALLTLHTGERELASPAGSGVAFVALIGAVSIASASSLMAAGFFLAVLWASAGIVDRRLSTLGFVLRAAGTLAIPVMAIDNPGWAAIASLVVAAVAIAIVQTLHDRRFEVIATAMLPMAAGFTLASNGIAPLLAVAVALGLIGVTIIAEGHRARSVATTLTGAMFAELGLLVGLHSLSVATPEPYIFPVLLVIGWLLHRSGESSWVAVAPPLLIAAAISLTQRLESGNAGHLVALGVVAIAVSIWGATTQQQVTTALGASIAVAVAVFEGLDQAVGIETWGWLVTSGAAVMTLAAVLESVAREPHAQNHPDLSKPA
ncbi:MAG: hypothetical protein V3V01_10940 [Acidimicrobiales bacterium]